MAALDNARAALARSDAWARPHVPSEASELLDYLSNATEALIAEHERGTTVTEEMVDAVQERLYDDYREGDRASIRAALEAALKPTNHTDRGL